ncbi:flagellin [Photobacterium kishitanii]|uniref:flagellin n=1 Tax=Photobacterium kishitanii TaxID=318456 RepID=UPI000B120CA7|nr:flagellin [Photobacterium kishitanii]
MSLWGGTSTGDKTFSLKLGDTEHKIEVTKDMTAEDFENKLNNIDGISNIKVTNGDVESKAAIEGVAATQTITGMTGEFSLSIGGIATAIDIDAGSENIDAIVTKINTAIDDVNKAAGTAPGTLDGMAASKDKDGNLIITGKSDGSTLSITAGATAGTAGSVTVGTETTTATATAGDGVTGATKQDATGVLEKAEEAGTFDIDLSKAKFDVGIETYDLNGAGDEAVNTGTVTTESVASLDLSTQEGAQNAIDVLDSAMEQVDEKRAEIGAFQNRMTHTMSNLANINENVNASNSRIKDVDFASETINMTKGQILQQAGTSILAQAKQIPQAALSLLG